MTQRTTASLVAAFLVGCVVFTPSASAATPPVQFGTAVRPTVQNLEDLEAAVGRPFDTTRVFFKWDDVFPSDYALHLRNTGHEMVVSVKPELRNGTIIPWADVANAQPGTAVYAAMSRWARALRDLRVPVFFTFNHEPEAEVNRSKGTASEYIAAWRRFSQVLQAEGATDVRRMWIMTAQAFRLGASDRRYAGKWYPGDDQVEGIASDAYNWFTCRTDVRSPWRSLAYLIEGQRVFGLAHPGEDLYVAEWGSAEDPAVPGRKAQWIRDARALFKTPDYAAFQGVSYFNVPGQGNCVWDVRSSTSSLAAFSEMGHDPYYGG